MSDQTATQQDQEGDDSGRAAVRQLFLDRLDQAGMVRPKGMAADDFDRLRVRLAEALAYLPAAALVTLAELVIELGAGPLKQQWPAEATVRNFARQLVPPPPEHHAIIRSWLRSIEGPQAREGGFLTELYRLLLRRPLPPPHRHLDYPGLRDEAEMNRRERARLRDDVAAGRATERDRHWLEVYAAHEARALALVAEGEAERAAKAARATSGAVAFQSALLPARGAA